MLNGYRNWLEGDDKFKKHPKGDDAMRDASRLKPWLDHINDLEKRLSVLRSDFFDPGERFMALIITIQWKEWLVKVQHYPVSHLFIPTLESILSPVRTILDTFLHRDLVGFADADVDGQLTMLRLLAEAAQIRFAESPVPTTISSER